MHTEAQVLTHVMDRTRQYTLFYFDKLKDQDLHRRFTAEGKELNSAFWLLGHLTAIENGLLLFATGGPFKKFSWAKHFTFGSTPLAPDECPPFVEMWETFNDVHAKAMAHLPTLSDEALEAPFRSGPAIIGPTVRDAITHAIRHEGSHVGHFGWLCKLYGIRTM